MHSTGTLDKEPNRQQCTVYIGARI